MSFLRELYVVFWKEMLLWINNPMLPVVRALVFPLLWIVIFGSAFGGDVNHIPLAVVLSDTSELSIEYLNALNIGTTLDIKNTNLATAQKMLKNRKVYGILYIPEDFSKKLAAGEKVSVVLSLDETTPQISSAIVAHVTSATQSFSKNIALAENRVVVEKNTLFGRGIEYLDYLAPGVVMMTILFSALFSGGLNLIIDREFGTLTMLMVSPVSRDAIILGKIFAGVLQSITSGVVALAVAMLMGVHLKSGAAGFLLMVLLMFIAGFGFIGMSTAIGTRISELEQLMVVMMVILMPMWFLSGGLYPIESMPEWMRPLAIVNPMTYATDAARAIMIRGIIWETLALDLVVITTFAVAMFIIGSYSFKKTLGGVK
jgi:ABC-2 type transport system permease protein